MHSSIRTVVASTIIGILIIPQTLFAPIPTVHAQGTGGLREEWRHAPSVI